MYMHRQWRIKLRETFGLSVYSIELIEAKLDIIVQTKTREVRKSLCKKLDNLISYKKTGDWWEKIERSETSGDNGKIGYG